MKYLSVCSGIEAATSAWSPLGWQPVGFAEIEPFPSKVLTHHYGSNMLGKPMLRKCVPNFGDFTTIPLDQLRDVDVLVGGTPCQAFSVAGKRQSLADARGNLSLAYAVLAHELARSHGLRWAIWENVPGVLSTNDNAFGCLLAALVGGDDALCLPRGVERWPDEGMVEGPRARAAWRIFDAQYFGLAQRRRRVFVVIGFGEGADPAAVLFERAGVRRHPPTRGEAGEGVAGTLTSSLGRRGGQPNDDNPADFLIVGDVAPPVTSNPYGDHEAREGLLVAHSLRGEGFDASEDGTGRGTPIVPVCFDTTQITHPENRCNPQPGDPCHPLAAQGHAPAIAFTCKDHGADAGEIAPTMRAMGHGETHANGGGQIAVAFDTYNQTISDVAHSLRNPNGTFGDALPAVAMPCSYGSMRHASTSETDATSALRALRREVGEEAFTEWGLGVSDPLQSAEVLRPDVHGESLRCAAGESRSELVNGSSSLAKVGEERAVSEVRRAGRGRRASSGWRLSKQCAVKLGAYLSKLSQQGASTESLLHDLWQAAEGLGLLRQALSAFQEMGRPAGGEAEPAHTTWAVRRLTPREAERLQGFPDQYTAIPGAADGPRYKALGNSFAVPVVRWIGERIQAQEVSRV